MAEAFTADELLLLSRAALYLPCEQPKDRQKHLLLSRKAKRLSRTLGLTPSQSAIVDCIRAAAGKTLSARIIARRIKGNATCIKAQIARARLTSETVRQHVISELGVNGGYRWVE